MSKSPFIFWLALLPGLLAVHGNAATYEATSIAPPPPRREFRAVWIATVANIDWPSRNDLGVAAQKAELIAVLDQCAAIGLNTVILQVRPACDALYASKLEPWSEYLTGTMGRAPSPFYDPLTFAIVEAHRRGLELHAWFNPYRARHSSARSPIAASHVSKTKPRLVRAYGSSLWLDPGEAEVQDYSLEVVLDVVKRYDVDGVHFDDYFYPYKETVNGKELDFPDNASWRKYQAKGAPRGLSREDWRRENVNRFITRVHQAVQQAKPWVKFGVSPFGIWRPGNPEQIQGLDAYDQLYADARLWLRSGWVDYLAPQLYWAIEPKAQSFPVLLRWWNEQNLKHRHIWPGIDTTKVRALQNSRDSGRTRLSWKVEEILSQIQFTADQPSSAGHIHWNARALLRNTDLQAALKRGPYGQPALVPDFPWLEADVPAAPKLSIVSSKNSLKLSWTRGDLDKVSNWVLQTRDRDTWTTKILPRERDAQIIDGHLPDVVALTAVNRVGKTSAATVMQRVH